MVGSPSQEERCRWRAAVEIDVDRDPANIINIAIRRVKPHFLLLKLGCEPNSWKQVAKKSLGADQAMALAESQTEAHGGVEVALRLRPLLESELDKQRTVDVCE